MIRFEPDTLRDALWRPIAMAAPDSGVYLEIMAPDLRFGALALLTVATLLLLRRRALIARPVWLLLAFSWLAFVPWLATSGNGRYFLPVLIVVGPLAIALIHHLPLTRAMRLALAALLVGLQGTAVGLSDPRSAWGLAPWGERYVDLDLAPADREVPAAYVGLSTISYSLVAPLFHPQSRWIGLANLPADADGSPDARRAQAALARARQDGLPLKLFVTSVPPFTNPDLQPTAEMRMEVNRLLGAHRLALAAGECRLLRSRTLAGRSARDADRLPEELRRKVGFWICPLQHPVAVPRPAQPPADTREVDRVFERIEQACPRLLPPGEATSVRLHDAYMRTYPSSDTRAYVMDDGHVYFKYWRALNANPVGSKAEVLADKFTLDCNQVRGRSGLPWERVL